MKITQLELENVKRVKAVSIEPAQNGLTVIGGKNGQGKTSVLDAIAWALGGESYRPSSAQREGSVLPPKLHVVLDNGIVVERSGKNSSLKVIDPSGKLAGQKLLDEFVEKLALDLPRFMAQNSKDKARTLLKIIGMEDEIKRLDDSEQQAYNRRRALGQIADQKKKYAEGLAHFPEAPEEIISAGELIEQQQAILQKNAENRAKRDNVDKLVYQQKMLTQKLDTLNDAIAASLKEKKELEKSFKELSADLETAKLDISTLQDESTDELEESIRNVDEINAKVRANMEKRRATEEAAKLGEDYEKLSEEIENIRMTRSELLNGANLPLEGLSVEQGELLYKGRAWDCMSSSEQLRVAVAIVRAINPKCNFVLIDKLEAMDSDTQREFGAWLEENSLQAICTRVGTDGDCQIIIEDGMVKDAKANEESKPATAWQKGVF